MAVTTYIDRFTTIESICDLEEYYVSQAWYAHSCSIKNGKKPRSAKFHHPTPSRIEKDILKSGYNFRNKALLQIAPRHDKECVIGITVVPDDSDRMAIANTLSILTKFDNLLEKNKIVVTGYAAVPEPQLSGRYHSNKVYRLKIEDAERFIKLIQKCQQVTLMESKERDIPAIYRYHDYFADCKTFGSWHLPPQLWYSLKTLFTKIDGIKYVENLRGAVIKIRSKHCSAVESRAWRKENDLRLNRISKTKVQPSILLSQPPLTLTYYNITDLKNSQFQRLTLKTAANDRPSKIILPIRPVRRRHHPLQPLPRLLLTTHSRPSKPVKQAHRPRQTGPPRLRGPPFQHPRSRSPPKPRPENGPGSWCFPFPLSPVSYKLHPNMLTIRKTVAYADWFARLRDERARARINTRLYRLQHGNPGDAEPVGEGVSELRIDYGPGYRVYYKAQGRSIVILLCGGDKSTQAADIRRAKEIAADIEE